MTKGLPTMSGGKELKKLSVQTWGLTLKHFEELGYKGRITFILLDLKGQNQLETVGGQIPLHMLQTLLTQVDRIGWTISCLGAIVGFPVLNAVWPFPQGGERA